MDSYKAMTDHNAFEVETKNHEDETSLDYTIASAFEFLDTSIQDGSKSLEELTSVYNRVISLMQEVASQEKALKVATYEADASHLNILVKVDALKQAHQRAKETNDMLAREVYAQKATLAKELKELQFSLYSVLGRRHGYLGVFDEMSSLLEMRLTNVIRNRELADKENAERETLVQQALAFEERQMLKVVEESKRLKQEEETNSKLQDLFKERELAVNNLRGELINQYLDFNSFRERLDQSILQQCGFTMSSQTPSYFTSSSLSFTSYLPPILELQPNSVESKNGFLDVKNPPVGADINELRILLLPPN